MRKHVNTSNCSDVSIEHLDIVIERIEDGTFIFQRNKFKRGQQDDLQCETRDRYHDDERYVSSESKRNWR